MLDGWECGAYREFLWVLTVRHLKVRYTQTVLGVMWVVVQRATAMIIFTSIFWRLAGSA